MEVDTAARAVEALRNHNPGMVASRWEIPDSQAGSFLRRLIAAKPTMPTIALIRSGSAEEEIRARSLGVSAVLPDDVDDASFRNVVCQLLHIDRRQERNVVISGVRGGRTVASPAGVLTSEYSDHN